MNSLQHTFGHVDCPACGATGILSKDPDGLRGLLFREAADKWLARRKNHLRKRTHYGYGQNVDRLEVFFHALRMEQIRPGHLAEYQRQRTINEGEAWRKPAGPSLVNHELSVMQSILKRAKLWKPFKDEYVALPMSRKRKQKVMEEEEELHLLSVAQGRPSWELAFWVASITENTGASGTELRYILLDDLHLGDKIPWVRIDDEHVKNEYRGRRISLNATAEWYFRKCLLRAKTLGSHESTHYLFPLRLRPGEWDVTKPAGASWMRRAFAQMRKAAGMPWLTPHCFRHQFATAFYESGADEMVIQHTMGHQSSEMTRWYSHNRLKHQKAALDLIDTSKRLGVQRVEYDPYSTPENKYSIGY